MNTPIYADFDQIVFEGRSQDYGAFQMRKRYNRVLLRASLIAFLLFISITGLPKMISWIMPRVAEEAIVAEEPMVTVVPVETQAKPEVKPDLPELPRIRVPEVRTVVFAAPNPTPDDQIQDEQIIAEVEDLENVAIDLVNKDGVDGEYHWEDFPPGDCMDCLPDEVKLPDTDGDDPDMHKFENLEKEPMPINLDELKHIIGYPPMAKEAEIEGKVTLRVMIDPFGNYVKHAVLKDPHPILTKAVTDKIHLLKTTPGIQAGKPIKVWVTVPFNFVLQK